MTPDELRKRADELDEAAWRAATDGDHERARGFLEAARLLHAEADARDPLQAAEHSANVRGVTSAQLDRRGRAISKSMSGGDPLLEAISASKWGSLTKYARKRLRIGPSTLSEYRHGVRPIPKHLASKVTEDFPDFPPDSRTWPKGTVD